jgi:tRNA G26 N,N-dimethylase Trm1
MPNLPFALVVYPNMEVNPMISTTRLREKKTIKNHDRKTSQEKKTPARNIYLQNCPVCGRPLEIPLEYRGSRVNCRHCSGEFTAADPCSSTLAAQNSSGALLGRAEQLLELCAKKLRLRVAG